jgi:adenylate cyclase
MTEERAKRKLSGILSADAVGYSRLMEEDEASTIQKLADSKELMANLIQQYRGRIVDAPGDNLLAEFRSVVDATECAVKIQQELKSKNTELPDNRRMEFRIGINLGDVVEEADHIYGNGVNIAARLEGLAEPGGICISRTAYDHVKNKLELGYEYLGEHRVKNIAEPVRVYRVLMEPEAVGQVIGEKRFLGRISRKAAISVIISLMIIAGVLIGWILYLQQLKKVEPASLEKMAYPLPDKPSIAVLPFDNLSDDPDQEYFSDGMTEEIITALSKLPRLFVIASNSTFIYKGKPVKIQQVSEELGVRYVLEGSVRKDENRVRITAQLIDAVKGHHLWAERYDREMKDTFALQDEITMKILTALELNLSEGEQAVMVAKGTRNLDAYLKVLQSTFYRRRMNEEDNVKARQLAEEAISLDPDYAIAYTTLGRTHIVDVWLRSTKSLQESTGLAIDMAEKALSLDESLADAYDIIGNSLILRREYEKAIAKLEQALKLEPNGADIHGHLGMALVFDDRPQEAVQVLQTAIRLNPTPPSWYLHMLATAYNFIKKYDEAIYWAEKAVQQNPKSLLGHVVLCSIYSSAGRMEDARKEASEILKISPQYSVSRAEKTNPLKNQAVKKRYFDALRKAGLPD